MLCGRRGRRILRVLVSIAPRSYREAVALTLMRDRPHLEVRIAAPEDLDREVGHFKPHLVVCNEVRPLVQENVSSWVQILFEDSMSALVSVHGQGPSEVHDISMDDLFGLIDETEKTISWR